MEGGRERQVREGGRERQGREGGREGEREIKSRAMAGKHQSCSEVRN